MSSIIAVGKSILFFFMLIACLLLAGYIFPFPLSYVHVASVIVPLYILVHERGRIVWYMFLFSFCQELLFPGTLFGGVLFAGTMSALMAYWAHRFFLTNRSVYTGLLLAAISLLSYRAVWLLYVSIGSFLSIGSTQIPSLFFYTLGIEFIVTQTVLLLLIPIFLTKEKRKNT